MKKYFLMAIMAATTLSFMSCDKKDKEETEEPQTEQKIVMEETATIYIGEEYELVATLSPAASKTITWTTSNAKVATIIDGIVLGLAEGETVITASAEGYKSATCTVTVVDPYKEIAWNGCQIWNSVQDEEGNLTFYSNDTSWIPVTTGDSIPCRLGAAYALLWSQGVTLSGTRLVGAGLVATIYVPAYLIIDDGKYASYYGAPIDFGGITISDSTVYDPTKDEFAYTAPVAKLVDPAKHYAYITGQSEEEGITGPAIDWVNYSDEEDFEAYVGLLGSGVFADINDELYYAAVIGWFQNSYFGLAINDEGTALKQPYEFGQIKAYVYRKLPQQSVAAAKAPARRSTSIQASKNISMQKHAINPLKKAEKAAIFSVAK